MNNIDCDLKFQSEQELFYGPGTATAQQIIEADIPTTDTVRFFMLKYLLVFDVLKEQTFSLNERVIF